MPRKPPFTGEEKPKHPLIEALEDCEYIHSRIKTVRQRIMEMEASKDKGIYSYVNLEFQHLNNYIHRIEERVRNYVHYEGIK
jgi:hypothetical protein